MDEPMAPGVMPAETAQMPRYEAFRANRHFGSLDGLRALSILGVLWHHSARHQDLPLASAGAYGVALFFAISGFLITTLLLREKDRNGSISLSDFYARRALRIFPLYYAIILVYVVAVRVVEPESPAGEQFLSNLKFFLTYTSNWFVALDGRVIFYFAWSLATEEQFYLVWPSIERFLGRHVAWLPIVLSLVAVAVWQLTLSDVLPLPHDSLVRTIVLSMAPAILLGVVLAHLLHRPASFAIVGTLLGLPMASACLLLAMLGSVVSGLPILAAHASMVLLVGACVVREDHLLARVLRCRPLVSIGKVSYGMYLMHMLVLSFAEVVARRAGVENRFVVFLLVLAGTWGAALLSYAYFETPFLRWKSRFAR